MALYGEDVMTANQALEWIIADAKVHGGHFTHDTVFYVQQIDDPIRRIMVGGCIQRIMECKVADLDTAKDLQIQFYVAWFEKLGIKGLGR